MLPDPMVLDTSRLPQWNDAWKAALENESATTEQESALLFAAVLDMAPGWAVEIGCWKCRTAVCLGRAALQRHGEVQVATVDPLAYYVNLGLQTNPPSPEWVRGFLANKGCPVELIHARSEDAGKSWDRGPITLLWIDGAHERADVQADWDSWVTHLHPDALVVFHDTHFPWIAELVAGWVAEGLLRNPRRVGCSLIAHWGGVAGAVPISTPWLDRVLSPERTS